MKYFLFMNDEKILSQGFQKCIICLYWSCIGCFIDNFKSCWWLGGLCDYKVSSLALAKSLKILNWVILKMLEPN